MDETTPHDESDAAETRDSALVALRDVMRLAVPNIMAAMSVTIMHFVDTTLVSWLGKPQLAAVSNAGVIVFALYALASGVATCVNTFASQSLGRGRPRECSAYAWQNAFFALAVGLAALPLAFLVPRIFATFPHAPDVKVHMVDYAQVRLFGLGFSLCAWGFCSYFQGIHRPWVAMLSTIVANVFNLLADCVLIFGLWGFPAYGIRGAAMATVMAMALQCAILIGFAVHPRFASEFGGWDTCRLDLRKLGQLIRIGWGASVTFFLEIASWAIFNNGLIVRFGTDALAANTAAVQYMHVSFMPTVGLSNATTALVGKYVGKRDIPRAKQRAYVALWVAMGYMLTMGVVFFAFRRPLIRHFSTDPSVVAMGATMLVFAAVFQGFDALGIISGGALRGAGDTRWPAIVGIIYCWSVFLPLACLLAHTAPSLGPAGPWIAATIYICLLGATLLWRFLSERWSEIDIFRAKAPKAPEPEPRLHEPT